MNFVKLTVKETGKAVYIKPWLVDAVFTQEDGTAKLRCDEGSLEINTSEQAYTVIKRIDKAMERVEAEEAELVAEVEKTLE